MLWKLLFEFLAGLLAPPIEFHLGTSHGAQKVDSSVLWALKPFVHLQ